MSQLHRRTDHNFRVWSEQLNYSLFGNGRGEDVSRPRSNWCSETYDYRQSRRHINAYVKYCDEWRKREYKREYDPHKLAALELRMIETDAFGCADYANEPIKGGIGHL